MSGNQVADQVWRSMSRLVLDNKDRWRRAVVDRTGLPFSRIRILRRLASQPMTVKQVAEAATIDAPAATVAVNDLEARGLVVRRPHPENRRCKLVSLTDAGRDVVAVLDATDDPAPQMLASLDEQDLQSLQKILARMVQLR
ncbi:MarR family winged helix-turn-helix transcriptional regulator [Mycolicibacterium sp. P1-5]|uniref:MarR family winged helix-turn-helix transcriptional regulator n=1 Tax=Mycolicibacterium sp. P1-5 TaxID=2024617 RepID=UPI0011F0927E|nr:MarR family transcriptional regulator [Mycolicibacterium sp. P1-5]KAA0107890.1 MarR family transcriptional regulator [Mycolicibacterium sp. P1-5]